MDAIHVWIGVSEKTSDEFYQYFAINETDRDAGLAASEFDKDLGTGWYDDDLIGVYYNESSRSLADALDELPLASQETEQQIANQCQALNINAANALFYYQDSGLAVTDSNKTYNGLTYLGAFDNR